VSPGEQAYARVRHLLERDWQDLTDEERGHWENGAAMPAVGAVLRIEQAPQAKVK
jgi:hypothetical protein